MQRGYFITFEGPDGSGKTTILKKVYDKLKENNIEIERTREPGGNNNVCEGIRQIVLNEFKNMNKHTEALLFAASRSQHVNEYIIPKLKENKNIISDRFLDSSIAYQGFGRKIGYEQIEMINQFGIGNFSPDFTFFFDLNPEVATKRIFVNPDREKNRFDFEKTELQKDIYLGYKEIIKKNKNRIIIIDASKSVDEVFDQVWKEIKKIFKVD